MQQAILLPATSGRRPRTRAAYSGPAHDLRWLVVVALAFTACQLYSALAVSGLGWDETVYVSQVDPEAQAAFFSAPRARGITLLLAPVAALTTSATVLHCYLAVLSGVGLLLTLWIWRHLLPAPATALGGALFAGLWITLFYGPQAMPNLWVAYAVLAATGCFLLAVRPRARHLSGERPRTGRGAAVGLAITLALAALMRPIDAVWLAVPLFTAALFVRSWRRPAVLLAVPAGLALGCAEWVAEAYASYGGLPARLRQAGEIQGGLGWHPSFYDHVRALQGKTLCRPCDMAWEHPVTAVWWFALPLAVAGAVWAALRVRELGGGRHPYGLDPVRAGARDPNGFLPPYRNASVETDDREPDDARQWYTPDPVWLSGHNPGGEPLRYGPAPVLLPALLGVCLAAPYLLMVDYAAPRFLLPAYALLLMPAGWFLYRLALLLRGRPAWAVAALVLALLGHEAIQLAILHKMVRGTARVQADIDRLAGSLRDAGVRPACVVTGAEAVRVAYRTGCASRQPHGHDASITPAALARLGTTRPAAVILPHGEKAPDYARGWRAVPLPSVAGLGPLHAYVSAAARR
ncbi:hypothetical protein [Streptomyces inhibens]|uniref:hypothetical protein n=1 Tax=Streptomyces inhibens TaxID=2293571 RepID=UPI001EE694A2|nr:hypothetical protein [Streptomyces inhibens]UKY51356.1 hypothetical protein KI385_22790 [Streptomyces inhibens]